MLVLSRKVGEQIVLPDCDATIEVIKITPSRTWLGIMAPSTVPVHRKEAWRRIRESGGVPSQPNGNDAINPPTPSEGNLDGQLARGIARRTGGRIRSLRVEAVDGRVVVHGRTGSYYARQLAQAAVLEALNVSCPHQPKKVEFDIEVVA